MIAYRHCPVHPMWTLPFGTRVVIVGFESRGPGVVVGRPHSTYVRFDRPLTRGIREVPASPDAVPVVVDHGRYDGFGPTFSAYVLPASPPDDNAPDE